jgi:collagenase-like PrtC family protease
MSRLQNRISYSLGFNFDPELSMRLAEINDVYGGRSRIDEVFAALPDCPISSARPTDRIPNLTWEEFRRQVRVLRDSGIGFNYLMNTSQRVDSTLTSKVKTYVQRLVDTGVDRITAGTPELCAFIKSFFSRVHVTISITYGTKSKNRLTEAELAGADAVYLDGVYVNRDFELLRTLLKQSRIECRLYANMSCISRCPVVGKHYQMFSGNQSSVTSRHNDAFFAGCSLVKLRNPVEWLQMPWIRPEDVVAYATEGVTHFKLADRLASTSTLVVIAASYLSAKSPDNLFDLMERDGVKYRLLECETNLRNSKTVPIFVHSKRLPSNFIAHFQKQGCTSSDTSCKFCVNLAHNAVEIWSKTSTELPSAFRELIPVELKKRAGLIN